MKLIRKYLLYTFILRHFVHNVVITLAVGKYLVGERITNAKTN